MQHRRFGRTELRMPVFSCGGMRYQQTWDDAPLDVVEEANQRNLEATIRRALELGITHIETARGYGTSERQLGLVFPKLLAEGVERDRLIVQTKILVNADAEEFGRQTLESLERLNLDHVDLLGLHGINTHELLWHAVRPGGCLEVARRLQREGRVRHVGFSTHGAPRQVMDAVCCDAHGGFDYVNLHWYYIHQRNWPAVVEASRRDMGVFIISPVHKGGLLNEPSDKLRRLCEPLHPITFNALFCLSRPQVHTLSIGAARPSDFDLQLEALPLLDHAAETLAPIVERLERAYRDALGPDYAEQCHLGIPEWEDAPGHMSIQTILWLRGLALAYDMLEYGKMRYNLLGNGGHWFGGLSAAHTDRLDPQKVAEACKASPVADRIYGWLAEAHALLGGAEVKRLSQS